MRTLSTLRWLVIHIALLVLFFGVFVTVAATDTAYADDYNADPNKTGVPECLTDEINGTPTCVWDAMHRENGLGHSLIITKWRAFRVPHGIAHQAAKGPVERCETFLPADPPVACVYFDATSGLNWAVSQDMRSYPLSERVANLLTVVNPTV